uniref:Uncharacterized protein n=1 Tax=Trichogramma kaykai TaxID=54128 RepID=A0ABD2XQY8_9HYME
MVYTYGSTDENPERYAPERIEIQGYSIDFTVMHNIKSVQLTRKVFEPLPEKYKRMIAAKEASDGNPAPLQPESTEQRKSPMLNESNNEGSKIKKRAVLESRDECGPFRDIDPQFNTEEIEEASGMEDIRNSLCTWKSKGEDSEEAKLFKYFGLIAPPSSLQFIVLQAVSVRGLQCVKNAIDKRFDNLERWAKYYTRMLHWLADYYYGVLITQPTVQQLIILKNFSGFRPFYKQHMLSANAAISCKLFNDDDMPSGIEREGEIFLQEIGAFGITHVMHSVHAKCTLRKRQIEASKKNVNL